MDRITWSMLRRLFRGRDGRMSIYHKFIHWEISWYGTYDLDSNLRAPESDSAGRSRFVKPEA